MSKSITMNAWMRRTAASLFLLSIGALAVAETPATTSQSAPLPIEDFFRKPAVRSPKLSPSGKQIAMLVPTQSGRIGLAVASVDTPSKFVGIAQFDDADVRSAHWVNDKRLVFDAIDFQAPVGDQHGNGLYAVNADGSDYRWLVKRTYLYNRVGALPVVSEALPINHFFHSTLQDGSDDIVVERMEWWERNNAKALNVTLMRLNTRTTSLKRLYPGTMPEGAERWVLDRNNQPRAVTSYGGGRLRHQYWREADSTEWVELDRTDMFADNLREWQPEAVDKEGNLYISAQDVDSADGTTALYRYDAKSRKRDEKPLLKVPGFDFEGQLLFDRDTQKLLGVTYKQEAIGVAWFDPAMKAMQAEIDRLLPSTNNIIGCARCTGARHVVVTASSDIQAPTYFLFEATSGKLTLLAAAMPWLDSRKMAGTQDFHRIKARDGMSLPVYVTKPKTPGPWPTVVMVHGGPFLRGVEWGFNPANQFLASRGYLVIEPEFRGSTGYGSRLFRAGWKQWGLKMQDDITDATRWAVDQGLADPQRIAIAGASYGGYATMMGLVKEPELYKAGINWVGVTDIDLMYSIGWSDFMDPDSPWVRYGMPAMIGDPGKDSDQLTATSPLRQARRIKQPVLMAYGEEDRRVPLPHGTKMRDALISAGNKNIEWVQYEGEGHGFMLTKNNVDFWGRVERFLARNLK